MFGRKNKKRNVEIKKETRNPRPVPLHRIKTQTWIKGILSTNEYWVETLSDAKRFAAARSKKIQLVKIYNQDGELVHQESYSATIETYA